MKTPENHPPKKPFSSRRWTDIPMPIVIGHREFTEEEKKKHDEDFERILKEYGVLKPHEHLKHSND